jgi:hypothetical protein
LQTPWSLLKWAFITLTETHHTTKASIREVRYLTLLRQRVMMHPWSLHTAPIAAVLVLEVLVSPTEQQCPVLVESPH